MSAPSKPNPWSPQAEREFNALVTAWLATQDSNPADSHGMSRAMCIARGEGFTFRRTLEYAQKRMFLCLWPLVGPGKGK